jgi:hypothetical protein
MHQILSEALMIIDKTFSLATGVALNPNNVWAGSAFEYLKGPALVSIGIISTTTQALKGLLTSCFVGNQLIAEEFEVPNVDPAIMGLNSPMLSNNLYIQAGGNGGDRLVNTLRNPTAGTIVGNAVALVTPVGGGRRR